MTEIYNYVNLTGWQYKQSNGELVVQQCPYCKKQDKLYINSATGASHCKYSGCPANEGKHITEILTDFGIQFNRQPNLVVSQAYVAKSYTKPSDNKQSLTPLELEWLHNRGLSDLTINYSKLYHVDRSDGYTLAIPFFRDGKDTLVKYRNCNPNPDPKEKAASGCEQILWNMDNCKPSDDMPLVITEGMIDAMSIIECGYNNVVSLPSGTASSNCLENCWDFICQFKEFILYIDDDDAGHECRSKLLTRLDIDKCRLIKHPRTCKDANDVLMKYSKEHLLDTIKSAYIAPQKGLVSADLISPSTDLVNTCDSLILPIKQAFNGYEAGALTLWTGDSGCGKTTILFNEIGLALRDNQKVCIFSGEMSLPVIKRWIYTPMAGLENIDTVQQRFRTDYCVKPSASNDLDRKYGGNLTIVDEQYPTVTKLLDHFLYSHKRYNSNIFVIDNLMVMNMNTGSKDPNQDQTTALLMLANFCKKYQVHIHLVAHQNKTMQANSKNKVSGSKNITNTSWNIIEVNRLTWAQKTEFVKDAYSASYNTPEQIKNYSPDSILNILKNRNYGDETKDIHLRFYPNSRRIVYLPFGKTAEELNECQDIYDKYGHDRDMLAINQQSNTLSTTVTNSNN